MGPDRIEREIDVDAPVERVWDVLTRAEHIGSWFGDAGAEVELRPGGAMVIRWAEHGSYRAVVERVERPRLFAWRWTHATDTDPRPGNSTLVEFVLDPNESGGTRLRVVESGFQSLEGTDEYRARRAGENHHGWREELEHLVEYAGRVAA
ncbi:MAG TPA: SRPBCC family protein [Gemmatimonadaceae bacterium]|nr:SRPBCC family protein [Gemmatimonadaceae bacterium]